MPRRVIGLAPWKPRGKSLAVLQVALDHVSEWPMLVRRVLYLAYELGLYPDKGKGSYQSVGYVLGRARRAGLLSWEAIADTIERVYDVPYDGAEGYLAETRADAERARLVDLQAGQLQYLIAWSEHRGLKEILSGVAREYGVPLIPAGGFDTHTARYHEALNAALRTVPTVVLHLSDLDKAGDDITDVLRRDLPELYRGLGGRQGAPQVVKVALTPAQAAEAYPGLDRYWDIQVDALPTPQLQGILREAITSRMDQDVLAAGRVREVAERQQLRALLGEGSG
jgi:hypothetical protein